MVDSYNCRVEDDAINIKGGLGWAKQAGMTSFKLIVLRAIMLAGGRFFPNLVRGLLQKLLIVGKAKAPFAFERHFEFTGGRWRIADRLRAHDGWSRVRSLGLGVDQTSIYVVMSRTFQAGQLVPWREMKDQLPADGQEFYLVRDF